MDDESAAGVGLISLSVEVVVPEAVVFDSSEDVFATGSSFPCSFDTDCSIF